MNPGVSDPIGHIAFQEHSVKTKQSVCIVGLLSF